MIHQKFSRNGHAQAPPKNPPAPVIPEEWVKALFHHIDTERYPAGTQMESVLRLTAQFMAARDRAAALPPHERGDR